MKSKYTTTTKHFVGQMIDYIEPCDEFIVNFLKREEGSKFSWPLKEDVTVVIRRDVKMKLPQLHVSTAECLVFPVAFDTFVMG